MTPLEPKKIIDTIFENQTRGQTVEYNGKQYYIWPNIRGERIEIVNDFTLGTTNYLKVWVKRTNFQFYLTPIEEAVATILLK